MTTVITALWLVVFATLAVETDGFASAQNPPASRIASVRRIDFALEMTRGDKNVNGRNEVNRREALLLAPSVALATLATASGAAVSADEQQQTVLITGANSGIGFDAATRLAQRGHRIILACRTLEKATDAITRIQAQPLPPNNYYSAMNSSNLIPAECDLADLSSIANFVKTLGPRIQDLGGLDVLCLNAGVARNTAAKDVKRTVDGFEYTVGINHLGHFYLTFLLGGLVKKKASLNRGSGGGNKIVGGTSASGGRIVVTASSVHDPSSPGGKQGKLATLGNLEGFERDGKNFEMVDGGPFNADKAYKDSKLCNIMFARELQKRLDTAQTGITVNCFSPGLIVSSGLFRDQNSFLTMLFDFAATDLLKVGESVHWGGGALEYMALDTKTIKDGGRYYTAPPGSSKFDEAAYGNQFTVSDISVEAKDDVKAAKLWDLSAKLVGLA